MVSSSFIESYSMIKNKDVHLNDKNETTFEDQQQLLFTQKNHNLLPFGAYKTFHTDSIFKISKYCHFHIPYVWDNLVTVSSVKLRESVNKLSEHNKCESEFEFELSSSMLTNILKCFRP